ncbi:hypothetical protein C7212DRAFT_364042 [Tuber magnatum]|uniref:Uncharacterized protein n=1 Tax=Tuber magnatum TaxID=42249 RepID=A0A317SQ81_9PEZI|nr:hypothetical protein C7212DRAFT_364042 [Tuber magnatum]
MAVELGSSDFDFANIPSMSTLVGCCQGLVAVDKQASTVKALSANPFPATRDTPFLQYCSVYWGVHAKMEPSDLISSPTLVHQHIWFGNFGDGSTPDGTGHDDKPNDTASESVEPKVEPNRGGSRSDLWWDRMNRLDDKIDGVIKDHGDFKVDVTRAIGKLGYELGQSVNNLQSEIHQGKSAMHKEFAEAAFSSRNNASTSTGNSYMTTPTLLIIIPETFGGGLPVPDPSTTVRGYRGQVPKCAVHCAAFNPDVIIP